MSSVTVPLSSTTTDIAQEFTEQLLAAVEVATQRRGEEILALLFAQFQPGMESAALRRARAKAERARRPLLKALRKQLVLSIEQAIRDRTRDLLAIERANLAALRRQRQAQDLGSPSVEARTRRIARRRKPVRPLPPPLDPEQIKHDAEMARLRAILKPVSDAPDAPAPAPVAPAPVVQAQRPVTPGEFLRALEKEIQEAVPSLGTLGPERCGAQIAVWAGQVREVRDRLSPDVLAIMRPAFRIFLEHLAQLREEMDAPIVDALEHKWRTPDWASYVEVNRARVENRKPQLTAEQLQAYHRIMLKALVLPHRRNLPQQAIPIITAAAEVLSEGDSQVRSAIRRHSSAWNGTGNDADEDKTHGRHQPEVDVDDAQAGLDEAGLPPTEDMTSVDDETVANDETAATPVPETTEDFDSLWTK